MNENNPKSMLLATIMKMDGAYADSTIRAYKDDFGAFINYCSENNLVSLPADPQAICSYIQKLIDDGRTSASIRRLMSGITTIHKLNRYADPTKDPDVLLEMRRMHRKIGRYSKQALGITSDILEKLIIATEAGNRGARDRALLLIAYDSLCRRSELTSLLAFPRFSRQLILSTMSPRSDHETNPIYGGVQSRSSQTNHRERTSSS